jgi:hypothetical protein
MAYCGSRGGVAPGCGGFGRNQETEKHAIKKTGNGHGTGGGSSDNGTGTDSTTSGTNTIRNTITDPCGQCKGINLECCKDTVGYRRGSNCDNMVLQQRNIHRMGGRQKFGSSYADSKRSNSRAARIQSYYFGSFARQLGGAGLLRGEKFHLENIGQWATVDPGGR